MAVVLDSLQFVLGRLLYPIRGHDSRQIIHDPALKEHPVPNMSLEAPECGPSGSKLLPHHTCLAEDRVGGLPKLRWTPPEASEPVKEYVLICEDIDIPIPCLVIHHGLFWGIPASANMATPADIKERSDAAKTRQTEAGWRFVPNPLGTAYGGAGAPYGHGSHRYVFTIIALNAPLEFQIPAKTTKNDIKRAMAGKVIGWGQWVGTFERTWSQ
ncbi:hypothetical protein N7462_000845 [Penicillium macrosclerotiorum]|uniref:uncharacterized protein n=1 Tax=Penicillium macrosclerotiorum TaxID=303699 RepID=UPI0025486197|nr:uncharacterized protein N7462_000845 [Penicillium macrosclerotiorum]KAJ5698840.1 hypothetical protein N7462_000845 [Penicillium macrosclerotiorum]